VTSEDIDPATLDRLVPRFTLQPLVENAIRHGLSERAAGGRLAISSRGNGASWSLTVSDDGVGGDAAHFYNGNGVGITVLRERLRLRFGDRAGLAVDTGKGTGCAVTVRLPIDADEPA
jgi:LytS/YehU family sensor histidine kinase